MTNSSIKAADSFVLIPDTVEYIFLRHRTDEHAH